MPVKSPFQPLQVDLDTNFHHHVFGRPEQKEWEDFTAYIDLETGQKRSYRQFLERIYDGATGLHSPVSQGGLGLNGDHPEMVGILGENCLDYPVLVNSLLALTIPYALLSFYSTKFELSHALRLCKVTRLFVHPNVLAQATAVAQELGIPDSRIHVFGGSAPGRRSFDEIVQAGQKLSRVAVKPAKSDTLAYLVLSSGTSGLSKGVMTTHGNLAHCFYQFIVFLEESAKVSGPPPELSTLEGIPTSLGFLPMYHCYGLQNYCFRTFFSPTTQVLMPKWDVKSALHAIQKYRVSHFSLIPSVVHQLVNYPGIKDYDLSSLAVVLCGAAHLPTELADEMSKLLPGQFEISQGYGLSEVTHTAMAQPAPGMFNNRFTPDPSSVGILWADLEAKVMRDDGTEAALNEPGELYLRGPNVTPGYWANEKANKDTFVDGWLRTGDMFSVDGEGKFYFVDRIKDTLKVSGIQVSPAEIETVLLAHPKKLIIDAAVAGVQGHGRTSDEKVPRAWVVLSPEGKKVGADEVVRMLDAWAQQSLSKYKWLRGGIEVLPEIPKLPTGKVLRRTLQEQYEKQMKAKL